VKSGYIFMESSSCLNGTSGTTMHRQCYERMFRDIEQQDGVIIVGFAQQRKQLKGVSGTFNSNLSTKLIPGQNRQCLFSFRLLNQPHLLK